MPTPTPPDMAPYRDLTPPPYRNGGPWWRSIAGELIKNPISSLLGAYLVWWITTFAGSRFDRALTLLAEHTAETKTEMQHLRVVEDERNARELRYQRASIRIQTITCQQQANTTAASRACEDIMRAWLEGEQ